MLRHTSTAASCPSLLGQCTALTTSGQLVGDCSNGNVKMFLGVPYAEAPIGHLRLSDPKEYRRDAVNPWKADTLPNSCPQIHNVLPTSEDCLYLNIWAPKTDGLKSVLVWVHGGTNIMGGSADPMFDGTKFATKENVIIVSFNYRLGILGFYDDGHNTNFAVKDSILALKWISQNIAQFGGNPRKITVFGNSSAGSIIRAMLASTSAGGLINNAIFQSDPQNYGFDKRSVSNDVIGSLVRELLGCENLACLRKQNINDILSAQNTILAYVLGNGDIDVNKAYPFGPVLDYNVLYKDYSEGLTDGTLANRVDIITGFVTQEAGPVISGLVSVPMPKEYYERALTVYLGPDQAKALAHAAPEFTKLLQDNASDSTRLQLEYTASMYYWQCPIQYNAEVAMKSSNVFVYSMSKGIQYPTNAALSLCANGAVCHQDDLYLTFGNFPGGTSNNLQSISADLQARWASFARSGNPNYNGGVQWNKATSGNLNMLDFGTNTVNPGYETQGCNHLQSVIKYSFQQFSK